MVEVHNPLIIEKCFKMHSFTIKVLVTYIWTYTYHYIFIWITSLVAEVLEIKLVAIAFRVNKKFLLVG